MLRSPETIGDDILETQVGTLAYYYGTTDPQNALICNGRTIRYSDYPLLVNHLNNIKQTGNPRADVQIPDCRGYFLRGLGGHSAKLGVPQTDAIRNVTGAFGQWASSGHGPFRYTQDSRLHESIRSGATTNNVIDFDLSRVVPTAEENRPINIAYNIIIFTGSMKKNLQFNLHFIHEFLNFLNIFHLLYKIKIKEV